MQLGMLAKFMGLVIAAGQESQLGSGRKLLGAKLLLTSDEQSIGNIALTQFEGSENLKNIRCNITERLEGSHDGDNLDFTRPDLLGVANSQLTKATGLNKDKIYHKKSKHVVKKRNNRRGLSTASSEQDTEEDISAIFFENDDSTFGSIVESKIDGENDAYRGYVWHYGWKTDEVTGEPLPTLYHSKLGSYELNGKVYDTVTTVDYEQWQHARKKMQDVHVAAEKKLTDESESTKQNELTKSLGRRLSQAEYEEKVTEQSKEGLKAVSQRKLGSTTQPFINEQGKIQENQFVVYERAVADSVGGTRNLNADHIAFQIILMATFKRQIGKDLFDLRLVGTDIVEKEGNYVNIVGSFYFARSNRFPSPPANTHTRILKVSADNTGVAGVSTIGISNPTTYVATNDLLTLGHEHGHSYGAEHDDPNAPPRIEGSANENARAYCDDTTGLCTLVSYGAPVFAYSQDGAVYGGVRLGDARHNNLGYMLSYMSSVAGAVGNNVMTLAPHSWAPTMPPVYTATYSEAPMLNIGQSVEFTLQSQNVMELDLSIQIGPNRKITFNRATGVVTLYNPHMIVGASVAITNPSDTNVELTGGVQYMYYSISLRNLFSKIDEGNELKFKIKDTDNSVYIYWNSGDGVEDQLLMQLYKKQKSNLANVYIEDPIAIIVESTTPNIKFSVLGGDATAAPSFLYTGSPTISTTIITTKTPTKPNTKAPSRAPVQPAATNKPSSSAPSSRPTVNPTVTTNAPVIPPTTSTLRPTKPPIVARPTRVPTTLRPTAAPTNIPTVKATDSPTINPTTMQNVTNASQQTDPAAIGAGIGGIAALAAIMAVTKYFKDRKNNQKPTDDKNKKMVLATMVVESDAENPINFKEAREKFHTYKQELKRLQNDLQVVSSSTENIYDAIVEAHRTMALPNFMLFISSPGLRKTLKTAKKDSRDKLSELLKKNGTDLPEAAVKGIIAILTKLNEEDKDGSAPKRPKVNN